MKKCFKCNQMKPLSEYYLHKKMADGHIGKCKNCAKSDNKKNLLDKLKDQSFFDSEKKRHRDKYHRLGYKEKYKPSTEAKKVTIAAYNERYPEKVAARLKLGRSPAGFHFHHWSYKKEHQVDVIAIKYADHYTLHRFLVYDQQRMCYKTKAGVLLDTKEKHVEHIRTVFTLNGTEPYI